MMDAYDPILGSRDEDDTRLAAPAHDSRDAALPLTADERAESVSETLRYHAQSSFARKHVDLADVTLLRYEATVVSLEAQITALTARAVRAEADAKRLDWLERMAHDGNNIGDIDIGGSWVTQTITVGDPAITRIRGEGATVREAIDRASAPRPATP